MAQPFLGEIKLFAGNFQIRGWKFCNGQLLSIADNDALYALLGTTYGGDGINTFALPNLQGRVPIHQGTGNGLTARVLGQASGVENVTLTTANLPPHTHQTIALAGTGTLTSPANALPAAVVAPALEYVSGGSTGNTDSLPAPESVSYTGGGLPHNNIMPTVALNYLIAVEGVFPQQN